MKTKLLLTILLSCIYFLAFAQVPQGFNYQAVARNASGLPIINQALPVRMTIQSDSLGGTTFWQELHASVMTNAQGVINLVLGKGARQTTSTVATFANIDWSVTPKFLRIEIDYSGWKTMGVSRLWSVPYALIAGDLAGSVKKLAVEGETSGLEEALFEVKNKDGQTVFAVYNEGVRVYVSDGAKAVKGGFAVGGFGTDKAESTKYLFVGKDSVRIYLDTNPLTKKLKGGFAVGGYDLTKGTVQDYLDVNSDSVRIYIDSNPETKKLKGGFAVGGYDLTKGIIQDYLDVSSDSVRIYIDSDPSTKKLKGGFAVGGYDLTKGLIDNYLNVNPDTSNSIYPSKNRIYWYPLKNAFLTGKVIIEKPDSVGTNSFASGYESKAKGQYSQALGYKAIARGDYSTAIGKNAVADSINSFAFGDGAKVSSNDSYAFGAGAIAKGTGSYAIGSAGRDTSGSLTGTMTMATGKYSFALGQGAIASDNTAFALGFNTNAIGKGSSAMGYQTTASGGYSLASGYNSTASGHFSTAIGYFNNSTAWGCIALGYNSTASGQYSTALGTEAKATGFRSTSIGFNTISSGQYSVALGYITTSSGHYSTAIGRNTKAIGMYSTAMNGVTSSIGYYSTSMGFFTKAKPYASLIIGRYNDTICTSSGVTAWVSSDPIFIAGNGSSSLSSNALTLYKNGNMTIAGTLTQNSDVRLKEKIVPLVNLLDKIDKIQPILFEFIDKQTNPGGRHIGFIAQEVQQAFPELVSQDGKGYLSVEYGNFSAVLLQAIKEQQNQIKRQQDQIESIKQENQQLKSEIDNVKALVKSLIANQTAQVDE